MKKINKNIFENSVKSKKFNIVPVTELVFKDFNSYIDRINKDFSPNEKRRILQAILRFSFFIEPVKKPKIESTKYEVRWDDSLKNDPRYSTYTNCYSIFIKLLNDFICALKVSDYVSLLKLIVNNGKIPHELNIDYKDRIRDGKIHTEENIIFIWDKEIKGVYLLRECLLNRSNSHFEVFSQAYEKLIVKSFLTDRSLTGEYKTNREKRWECHPKSVHFALRKECLAIESKLIKQICHFNEFPDDQKKELIDLGYISSDEEETKCPITRDTLSFAKFYSELRDKSHGKSYFHVGHLHPLKSANDKDYSGHTADNVSWFSSEGNRIQGDLSVEDTKKLILRIANAICNEKKKD